LASGNSLAVFVIKPLNIQQPYNPTAPLLAISSRGIRTYPHKNLHTNVYNTFIHEAYKLEVTQVSFNK
jgi:hypothetical protein